jgi:DNA polymerase
MSDREAGATFAPADLCFCDFESIGHEPIEAGTDRYARNAQAIILTYAIGEAPIEAWTVTDFDGPLDWKNAPADLVEAFQRVDRGEMVLVAHNAGFDRAIWEHATRNFPPTEPWMWICSKVQAMASGLPASLDLAAKMTGALYLKDKIGKELIKLFALPTSTATPQTHPDEWQEFIRYAVADVAAMREVFHGTRQLALAEWKEFWASERINDQGVMIDVPLVEKAAKLAAEDQHRMGAALAQLTGNVVTTVNQVARITTWLHTVLPAAGREMLVKRDEEIDLETGEVTKPRKDALTRDRVVRLIAYLQGFETPTAPLAAALRVLQIRLYGGSKTPAKFSKMLSQQVGGIIRGQYVFGGASQTGRFSAKGVQIHNLARDPLPYELAALDALADDVEYDAFAKVGGDDAPVARKLSLLIRPTLIAPPSRAFAWGDWSNIEARLVTWLANDPDAEERLEIFRAVDKNPKIPDIYTRTAAELSNIPVEEVTKAIRQQGKVVELACGFGGAKNALLSMAAGYGIHLDDDVASAFVKKWREENQWAVNFWGKHDSRHSFGLWGALNQAIETPSTYFPVGRVGYIYLREYLGGSLLCQLPSGRWLTYRRIKYERIEEEDDDGNVIDVRYELMFSRDMGRIKFWPGLACENVVQATAADILRGTLLRLDGEDYEWMPTTLHTHDEIVSETDEEDAGQAAVTLRAVMERGFDWSKGLPIAAETTVGRWYTKARGSVGL